MSAFLDVSTIATPGQDATAAINAALANGCPALYYPSNAVGWYQTNVDLTLNPSGTVAVFGDGAGPSRIMVAQNGGAAFASSPASVLDGFISFRDIEIASQARGTPNAESVGFSFTGPPGTTSLPNINFRGVRLSNLTTGIALNRVNNAIITGVNAQYCSTGIDTTDCGDLVISDALVELGGAWGVSIKGTPAGQASHQAEGARLSNVSTNGQVAGLYIQNFSFFDVSNGSFTSCPSGGAYLDNASQGVLSGGEYQGGSGSSAITLTASCNGVRLAGLFAYGSGNGMVIGGTRHAITGVTATANNGCDLYMEATESAVTGVNLWSPGYSIVETAPAANNRYTGCLAAVRYLVAGNGSTWV